MENKWCDRFLYDESSPSCLVWKDGRRAGEPAGYVQKKTDNRSVWRVDPAGMKRLNVHRFIWELHNGPIPEGLEVDHINGNALDNRISNLRVVTHKVNMRNMKRGRSNLTGVIGLHSRVRSGFTEWYSIWNDESGVQRKKVFSEKRYGGQARNLAIEARKQALDEVGGYTERHGK